MFDTQQLFYQITWAPKLTSIKKLVTKNASLKIRVEQAVISDGGRKVHVMKASVSR